MIYAVGNGELYKSSDGGATWRRVNQNQVSRIAVHPASGAADPSNPARIHVTTMANTAEAFVMKIGN